ncbi:MAG: hypothetical protein HYV09_34995 [Deltaproteobacteria bacterium]|nr:hypothetical protein [Deltaproteobacteria bacterium]
MHLEAAVRPERIVELATRAGVALPDGFGPRGFVWRDLTTFVREYDFLCRIIRSAEDYATVASDYLADAAAKGAVYVDFIVSPAHGWMNAIAYPDLVDALGEALARATRRHGISASLSLTAVRAPGEWFGPDQARRVVREAVAHPSPWVRGFGVAGDVRFDELASYAPAFRAAKDAGLVTRAHCGEGEGARGVEVAMDVLGVDLLDHATDALSDPRTLERIIHERRLVTLCPMAHVLVGLVPSIDRHPAWAAMRAGLRVCLGTDDPVFFRFDVADTYAQVATNAGVDHDALVALTRNAVTCGLLGPEDQTTALSRLDPARFA